MKIRTIITISIIFIVTFIIYLTSIDNKIYYFNFNTNFDNSTGKAYHEYIQNYLEDKDKLEKSINEFSASDYRTTDLIRDIRDNKKIKKQTIKNALIKADLITLSIGTNDFTYKIGNTDMKSLYNYSDELLKDLDELLNIISEYCKEDIIFLGYYNSYGSYYDDYFNYINKRAKLLCQKHDIEFIKIQDIYRMSDNREILDLNESDHKRIFSRIVKFIDDEILD